ncbi:MAG: FG-GAP repeat protein [Pseudomonadales bacterium]|nr:FG-GAP repeat protein [Pseudomonadales bacterium]
MNTVFIKKIYLGVLAAVLFFGALPAWALTVTQEAKLLPPEPVEELALFGQSVSLDGDTAVIGAFGDDDVDIFSGAAYVFTRSGNSWSQQAKLVANDGARLDFLGVSVSLDGDTAVVGAHGEDDFGSGSGAAYVFTRSGSTWTEQAKLKASDAASGDSFGSSVSIVGDTILVGAGANDDDGNNSGSVYVFTRSGSSWSQEAKLVASDGAANDRFGASVAVEGDTAVIGANGSVAGAAYVFTRSGTTWTERSKLVANDGALNDGLGISVAMAGDTVIAGVTGDDDAGNASGSAYVFTGSGDSWAQQAKLVANDASTWKLFGHVVSLDGDTAVIGAFGDGQIGNNVFTGFGAAYVFTRSGSSWSQEAKLVANDGAASDVFGFSVAVKGDTALIGAFHDNDKGFRSGSVYVFSQAILIIVDIDIKPGSAPNSINLCSGGAVPIAILGSDTFDVNDINNDTLRFAEAAVKMVGKKSPYTLCSVEDVSGDFIDDLVCHFVTQDIAALDGESTTATLNGELLDGTPFNGMDSINIVKDTCN